MMRRTTLAALTMASLGLALSHVAAAEDGPWVGTYEMKLPDEVVQQMKDAGAEPPTLEITLHADGSYTSKLREDGKGKTGKGSYTVDGSTITVTELERDGEPVPDGTEPMVLEGGDGFAVMAGDSGGMPLTFVRR